MLGFEPDLDKVLGSFTRYNAILRVKPKFYSCSQGVIPWLEVLKPIGEQHKLRPTDIDKIVVGCNVPLDHFYVRKINHFQPPRAPLDAQLSVNFGIALFLVEGGAFVDEYTPANLRDPEVLALTRKVRAESDVRVEGLSRITILRHNGRSLTGEYPLATLHQPYRPVKDEYRPEFERLTTRLAPNARQKLWNDVMNVGASRGRLPMTP